LPVNSSAASQSNGFQGVVSRKAFIQTIAMRQDDRLMDSSEAC